MTTRPRSRPRGPTLPLDAFPWLPFLLVALVAAGGWYVAFRRRRQLRASYDALLASEPGLTATSTPCGLTSDHLAGSFAGTPRGDRRYGVRHGVDGPLPVEVVGAARELPCTVFQWWSEQRRTTRSQHGTSTRYVERSTTVASVRLPTPVPTRIDLRPESVLGRVGLTRGGQQLESSEFNRRFRVDTTDPTLSVQLLDAGLQRLLTEEFAGRTVEVTGDLLVLGGSPGHRDPRYLGVVGELSAARQDARRLVAAVPPQFWRACGLDREA